MAFQVHKLLLGVPRFCTFTLLVCLLLTCSHSKPCKCPGSNQDQLGQQSINATFDKISGCLLFTGSNHPELVYGSLSSYMESTHPNSSYMESTHPNSSYMESTHPKFSLSNNTWFFTEYGFVLWEYNDDGTDIYEASFSFVFTFSIYAVENQTEGNSNLVLAILPRNHYAFSALQDLSSPVDSMSRSVAGSRVSTKILVVNYTVVSNGVSQYDLNIIMIHISIEVPQADSLAANKYSMRIDYDHIGHHMYVYLIEGEGTPAPVNAIAERFLNISNITKPYSSLAFFSTMGQLLQLHTWNSKVDMLPDVEAPVSQAKTIILSSVLGSAATTAITAYVVYFYFTSKYRRWKKEQDKLTKAMQQLPGVPTQVDYADIRKATKNFHETMKLGKGGFGAVYRCTLPASASRTGQAMEVAVKKFMREVEDRRYNDFLAEVSIINRLRHKNIVPLVGWSYNKGEPLLVYEYMTNGSLDQHLFRRGSKGNNRHEEAATRHWNTRYGIVRDVATGLHYVHHEHEPLVLHRDIKASNIMLDSSFGARLGDFGIACTVAVDRSSVTGVAGTIGYIAPDYAISHRATRQSDIYAFGVLMLEIVTGKKSGDVPVDDGHITDWAWRLHQEGKLLEALDSGVLAVDDDGDQQRVADEAKRLLLLGLACTNPNPSDRPSMAEVVQIITKVAPPPEVPLERPTFVWPPAGWRTRNSMYSTAMSTWDKSSASMMTELVQFSQEQPPSATAGGQSSFDCRSSGEWEHMEP